jgi:hypothetical protein
MGQIKVIQYIYWYCVLGVFGYEHNPQEEIVYL